MGSVSATDHSDPVDRTVTLPGPASPGATLAPWRRGRQDPTYQITPDGALWRTTLLASGPVTARIVRVGPTAVRAQAWGVGAAEFADALPALLGADDDWSDFTTDEPTVAAAARRAAHLRLGRTDRVLEALIPAVIEQRVPGADAFRAWRSLVTRFGTRAPGPAPGLMRVLPAGRRVASHPVMGVPPRQRRSGPGAHHCRSRATGGLAGAAEHPRARRRP